MSQGRLRLAIVGCRAVTELDHLPAAALVPEVEVVALVDKNRDRARELAEHFSIAQVLDDYQALGDDIEAAIVALPHNLHAPVTIDLLGSGLHVLVEKPMAITPEECAAMRQAAEAAGRVLAVGHYRRFAANVRRLRETLGSGLLGTPLTYVCEEGVPYDWPSQSGFVYDRVRAGGGALVDSGVHGLDWLMWLFGEAPDCCGSPGARL
jgi:predicted dehydrogenase